MAQHAEGGGRDSGDATRWLEGPEELETYLRSVRQRLSELREARRALLERAQTELIGLREEALLLGDGALASELEARRQAAELCLSSLTAVPTAPVWPDDKGQGGPPVQERRPRDGGDGIPPDGPARLEAGLVADAASVTAAPLPAPIEAPPCRSDDSAAPEDPALPQGTAAVVPLATDGGLRLDSYAPEAAALAEAPQVLQGFLRAEVSPECLEEPWSGYSDPEWRPRPLSEVDAEVARVEQSLEEGVSQDEYGLLELKAMACRLRLIQQELCVLDVQSGYVHRVQGALRGILREQFPHRYAVPLDPNIVPRSPSAWERLASRYEGLSRALKAFEWYLSLPEQARELASKRLLEPIGATQQLLFRQLNDEFAGAIDDQQRQLYKDVLQSAHQFLGSLDPQQPLSRLDSEAAALEGQLSGLVEDRERTHKRDCAIQRVHGLASHPAFGTRDQDSECLRGAVAACLELGVPPSNRDLRDALLPWAPLLADDPALARLSAEVGKELDRRKRKGLLMETDEDSSVEGLSLEVRQLLTELLPLTQGKRALFVGGTAQEEKRRQLEEALGLQEIVWPERKGARAYDYEHDIARTDITVLLIRFMRTGMKQAVELAHKHGRSVVRLPRGLGLPRVIQDLHGQLVPRD
ncbi:MAG TPA: hypothetical protein VGN26_13010 [Armatimonadota bacterium]|jgi:hypothetical protein